MLHKHQAVTLRLARMATKIHVSRSAYVRACQLYREGSRDPRPGLHAKIFACDAAVEVATEACELIGGYAHIRGLPIEKLARDARLCPILHGANDMLRLLSMS